MIVLGAAGFIGSNITYELVKQGYDVVGIDNMATGFYGNVKNSRFDGLKGDFEFIRKDINIIDLYTEFKDGDIVFLLAALPRVQYSIDFPLETNKNNITGLLNVLESARLAHVKKVIFSSSSSVYGGVAEFPTKETAHLSPKSPYAVHKAAGEYYCRVYGEIHGLDTVCLRYFNVFGVNQRAGSAYATVIPAFLEAAVNNGVCRIDGEGKAERDFCYVDNVVQANILAAKHESFLGGECFNIACGECYSVMDTYDEVCKLSGKQLNRVDAPRRQGDPLKSLADISKAQNILGYNPTVKFSEGMAKTYKWWETGCK